MSTPMEALAEQLLDWSSHGDIELTDEQVAAMSDLLIHEHAQIIQIPRHDASA